MSVVLLSYTDFNEICHGHTLIPEKGHKLLFTASTDIHASGAAGKS